MVATDSQTFSVLRLASPFPFRGLELSQSSSLSRNDSQEKELRARARAGNVSSFCIRGACHARRSPVAREHVIFALTAASRRLRFREIPVHFEIRANTQLPQRGLAAITRAHCAWHARRVWIFDATAFEFLECATPRIGSYGNSRFFPLSDHATAKENQSAKGERREYERGTDKDREGEREEIKRESEERGKREESRGTMKRVLVVDAPTLLVCRLTSFRPRGAPRDALPALPRHEHIQPTRSIPLRFGGARAWGD